MVGGNEGAFEIARPLFEIMGQRLYCAVILVLVHGKSRNNMILGISMIGVCEAFSMAKNWG